MASKAMAESQELKTTPMEARRAKPIRLDKPTKDSRHSAIGLQRSLPKPFQMSTKNPEKLSKHHKGVGSKLWKNQLNWSLFTMPDGPAFNPGRSGADSKQGTKAKIQNPTKSL